MLNLTGAIVARHYDRRMKTSRKAFPRGHKALVNEGFVFVAAGACHDCGASVLWYLTPERQKRMPIDAAKKIPRWAVCPALVRGKAARGMQLDLFAHKPSAAA